MKDSRDNNSLKEIRTKEMPRYNKQAQMDGDELSDLLNFDGLRLLAKSKSRRPVGRTEAYLSVTTVFWLSLMVIFSS